MTSAGAAMLLGPLGAVLVVPGALALLFVRQQPRWAARAGVLLTALVVVSWVGYWWLWGRAFDYADTHREVPHGLQTALDLTMTTAAVGCVALIVTTVAGARTSAHQP